MGLMDWRNIRLSEAAARIQSAQKRADVVEFCPQVWDEDIHLQRYILCEAQRGEIEVFAKLGIFKFSRVYGNVLKKIGSNGLRFGDLYVNRRQLRKVIDRRIRMLKEIKHDIDNGVPDFTRKD